MIGAIENYRPGQDFMAYIERMEQFFIVNDIKDDTKQVALFITLIGPECYGVLKNILSPEIPKNKKYVELVQTLSNHYVEKQSIIAARYEFYKCQQKSDQTINEFVVEIKRKAALCDFQSFLCEALRDKLVCGLKDQGTISRLLTEDKLPFEKAIRLATSLESATKETKNIQPEPETNIQVVNQKGRGQNRNQAIMKQGYNNNAGRLYNNAGRLECRCCGGSHFTERCFKKDCVCFICKKQGHLAHKCRFRNIKNLEQSTGEAKHQQEENNYLSEEDIILGSIRNVSESDNAEIPL
jgi:hypothetical protein